MYLFLFISYIHMFWIFSNAFNTSNYEDFEANLIKEYNIIKTEFEEDEEQMINDYIIVDNENELLEDNII